MTPRSTLETYDLPRFSHSFSSYLTKLRYSLAISSVLSLILFFLFISIFTLFSLLSFPLHFTVLFSFSCLIIIFYDSISDVWDSQKRKRIECLWFFSESLFMAAMTSSQPNSRSNNEREGLCQSLGNFFYLVSNLHRWFKYLLLWPSLL